MFARIVVGDIENVKRKRSWNRTGIPSRFGPVVATNSAAMHCTAKGVSMRKRQHPEISPKRPEAVLPITDVEDEIKSDHPIEKNMRKTHKRKLREANDRSAPETPTPDKGVPPELPKLKANHGAPIGARMEDPRTDAFIPSIVENKSGSQDEAAKQYLAPDAPLGEKPRTGKAQKSRKPQPKKEDPKDRGIRV